MRQKWSRDQPTHQPSYSTIVGGCKAWFYIRPVLLLLDATGSGQNNSINKVLSRIKNRRAR